MSASTIASMAPRTMSSHMNQNRYCPGVPNRYRIRSSSSETRPKSMATVVVVLSTRWVRSSTCAPASVMTASVRSGTISDTEPTNVVLPAPNPPATTIFTEVVATAELTRLWSELSKATENPFEQREIRCLIAVRLLVDADEAFVRHVAYQDAGDSERHPQTGGDLGDGSHLPAHGGDGLLLQVEA
ncbi:hypothetical protein FMEAI12_3650022 [Parafrankia sp. Ea1.12]|nr:hypothetical protein FMEAI12_3650022 [Parafrankia sp. Ea1.12]